MHDNLRIIWRVGLLYTLLLYEVKDVNAEFF